jgi:PDZ domain-containing protein
MNKKGSALVILLIIIVVLVVIAAVWYYESQKPVTTQTVNPQGIASSTTPTSTPQPFSFSCPQSSTTTLTAYENQQAGIAFCYPSDLVVGTNTISWPNSFVPVIGPYSDPAQKPILRFQIITEPSPILMVGYGPAVQPKLAADITPFEADGNGADYALLTPKNQITVGNNQNGFHYVTYREDFVLDHDITGTNLTVWSTSTGPFAFIPLIGQKYLIFTTSPVPLPLPSYVDADLKEILSTVAIMPQQYTGVGLTLTTNASGKIAVYDVIAKSPALAAGIKLGDIITGFNGTSTATMSLDAMTSFLDATTGTVMLDVQEGASQTSIPISLTPTTLTVSGSDLGAMYENPF